MATPTAQNVADFLGQGDDTQLVALAGEHLPIVTAMVERYVRGRGFTNGEPDDPIAAVIVSSTARLVNNPSGTEYQATGPFQIRPGVFNGWTLPELAILHSYRARAR
jgi:hypothetical protein